MYLSIVFFFIHVGGGFYKCPVNGRFWLTNQICWCFWRSFFFLSLSISLYSVDWLRNFLFLCYISILLYLMRVFVSILIRLQLVGVLVTIYFLVWMLCIDGVCVRAWNRWYISLQWFLNAIYKWKCEFLRQFGNRSIDFGLRLCVYVLENWLCCCGLQWCDSWSLVHHTIESHKR